MADEAKRDAAGRLQRGHAMGRPPGKTELERIRALIAPNREAIVATLVAGALVGDVKAAEALLDRLAPRPRPTGERVHVPGLREATTIQGKADAILAAVAGGGISAEAGRAALAMLADYAKVRAVDDLEARLARLEAAAAGGEHAAGILALPAPVAEAELV